MVVGLPHTLYRQSMQTTWRCCDQKAWCWTFRQKVSLKRHQVSVKKLNANEPLMTCRKGSSLLKVSVCDCWYENCSGYLFTGYRTTGIKVAGSLHRLLYETWEAYRLMCNEALQEVFFFRKRLFNKYSTVHTATQSCLRQELQQGASDGAMMIFRESGE